MRDCEAGRENVCEKNDDGGEVKRMKAMLGKKDREIDRLKKLLKDANS